jgi:hypothetical protein
MSALTTAIPAWHAHKRDNLYDSGKGATMRVHSHTWAALVRDAVTVRTPNLAIVDLRANVDEGAAQGKRSYMGHDVTLDDTVPEGVVRFEREYAVSLLAFDRARADA